MTEIYHVTLEDGWDNQIKAKAIDRLEHILENGMDRDSGKNTTIFGPSEYVQIYTTCYDMCTQRSPYNWSRELYQRHGETIQHYLQNKVLPELKNKSGQSGPTLLTELQKRWTNHQIMNKWLKRFFTYLDRYYVKHHSLPTLSQSGMRHFREEVYDRIKGDSTNAVLELIHNERERHIIDTTLVRTIVELYEEMGMDTLDSYTADMEEPFLTRSREYYAQKREDWINESTPEYMIKTENAFTDEKNRVAEYLHSTTDGKIVNVLCDELLERVEQQLLEKDTSGCRALLQNDKSADLQRMFRLFDRLDNGLNPIAVIFQKFISDTGGDEINRRQARLEGGEKDKNDDPKFIKALIVMHQKYVGVAKTDFGNHALFQKALKDAFVEIVNKNVGNYTNAELLSSYADRILRSGGEKLSEAEVEDTLDRIVELFTYLHDKDLFAEIYRNQLAKRLLTQRSTSEDVEKLMISKLKVQCGTQFTSKMEGMLGDLSSGGAKRQEFEKKLKELDLKLDFGAQVLTSGHWPTYPNLDVTLTPEMSKCLQTFKEWHENTHAKRKLTWVLTQGNATVRGTFGKKSYDLQVTSLQAIVLHALSCGETVVFSDLANRLNLDDAVMKPLMHSLSCGKYKVISKSPACNKVSPTDKFTANSKFSCSLRKFRIPMASLDASFSVQKVEEDRSYVIEAAIVRIMKARKTLEHQQLIAEVMNQMTFFNPAARLIKKRIEALIDREYLERDENNTGMYKYMA